MGELIEQPTNMPTRKIAATIAGGITSFIGFMVLRYAGIELPPDVITALSLAIACGLGYVVKERAPEM